MLNTEKLTQSSKQQSELPNQNRPATQDPKRPNQLARSQNQAEAAAEKTKVALVAGHQERLVKLSASLDKAEQRREETLDRLSDRVAYLQDENLFMHDLLNRAQKKLKGNQTGQKQEVTATALDALVDAFDSIGEWELPAIAPATPMGCLPIS